MKTLFCTLLIILGFNLLYAQPFTHSGFVYGANGQGLKDIPVLLFGKRVAAYEVTFPNYPASVNYTTGTVVPSSDDVTHGPFPIGFSFTFFGNTYTQFYIGSNGWIGFSPGQTTGYTAAFIPNASSPINAILADWEDLLPGSSNIRYVTSGVSPSRTLTVSFNAVPHYGCGSNLHTFQFVLYETSNIIDINYASKPLCGSNNATAGLISTSFSNVVPVGGKNASTWSVTNYSVRFIPSSPEIQFTLKGTYLTNSSGQYNMVPNLDDASHDFQIRLQNLIIDTPKLTDARFPIQVLLGEAAVNAKTYYTMDINRDGILSVSDSYCIFGKMSGRFANWPNSYPAYRIFTQGQWSTINGNNIDLRFSIPGVQSLILSSPARGGSTNFYILRTGLRD
jgi:hypothetical protein